MQNTMSSLWDAAVLADKLHRRQALQSSPRPIQSSSAAIIHTPRPPRRIRTAHIAKRVPPGPQNRRAPRSSLSTPTAIPPVAKRPLKPVPPVRFDPPSPQDRRDAHRLQPECVKRVDLAAVDEDARRGGGPSRDLLAAMVPRHGPNSRTQAPQRASYLGRIVSGGGWFWGRCCERMRQDGGAGCAYQCRPGTMLTPHHLETDEGLLVERATVHDDPAGAVVSSGWRRRC